MMMLKDYFIRMEAKGNCVETLINLKVDGSLLVYKSETEVEVGGGS